MTTRAAAVEDTCTVNVPETAPAGTNIVGDNCRPGALLETATRVPPAGAADDNVTVHVVLLPGNVVLGVHTNLVNDKRAETVSVVVLVTEPPRTEIVDVPAPAVEAVA